MKHDVLKEQKKFILLTRKGLLDKPIFYALQSKSWPREALLLIHVTPFQIFSLAVDSNNYFPIEHAEQSL